jgi:hypothetical protein
MLHRIWSTRPIGALGLVGLIGLAGAGFFTSPLWAMAEAREPVALQGHDFFFAGPEHVAAGTVTIRFTNVGLEPHHAQLVHLPDDLTVEQFAEALRQDERAALGLVRDVGGAATVAPGLETEVGLTLEAGTYAFICVIPSPSDRIRHLAKGMVMPLVVTEPAIAADPPVTVGTMELRDFTFEMPEVVPSGRVTYRVANEGPAQPHEIAIVRLTPGATAEDVRRSIMTPSGPPPYKAVGGFQATEVGGDGYVTLDLEPGEYAAICRVTEPMSGVSHVHLGMVKGFRVE